MLKMFLLLLAYAIAPVVGGHGMLPMAWFLVSPALGSALAWLAIIVVIASYAWLPAQSPAQLISRLAGAFILYGAWFANTQNAIQFNSQAEQRMALESMLVFSLPFQVTVIVVVYLLAAQLKRAFTRPQDAP